MGRRDDTDPVLDRQLRELCATPSSEVEPEERLGRAAHPGVRPRRRPALLALAGAGLAGAAVVAAVGRHRRQLPAPTTTRTTRP